MQKLLLDFSIKYSLYFGSIARIDSTTKSIIKMIAETLAKNALILFRVEKQMEDFTSIQLKQRHYLVTPVLAVAVVLLL